MKESDWQEFEKLFVSNLTKYCREWGYEEVFVQTDQSDGNSIDFYLSTKQVKNKLCNLVA
jgi:hypothetical protein